MGFLSSLLGISTGKKVVCDQQELADLKGQIAAMNKSQAIIEFDLDGYILNANDNFLNTLGYSLDEIKSKHHSLFVESHYASSEDYKNFWQRLMRGEFVAGQFKRVAKGQKEVWIEASYNPIFDANNKPFKIIQYATNITHSKILAADFEGQLAAIGRSQAIIEFDLDGNILNANANFLQALGYSLDEIKGQHHRLFVEANYASSLEYKNFWRELAAGKSSAGEYKRFGKGGEEIWINASYNPILDSNNKPYKVVKYATDVTAEKMRTADYQGQLAAIGKAQAVIEFDLKGNILTANDNFLKTMGYSLEEINGKHHSLFVTSDDKHSGEYKNFWQRLGNGEYDAGQYKRMAKNGKEIWIQASYNPIFDMNNKPFKVVKYATNISDEVIRAADFKGQLAAISKAQAVIEFDLKGNVLTANDNFLAALGYSLDEIKGKHHSLFVEPSYKNSIEYQSFWERLSAGKFDAGQYKRIAKGGKEIWIQASYNPIMDANNKPFKVVKYATDITADKIKNADYEGQLSAISKAQAVIEFDLSGNILTANENFLNTLGYRLDEIQGRHHSLFVMPDYKETKAYQDFWKKLSHGDYDSGQYKRLGKGGKVIWIQASYNPILDANGKPFKVVKFATDITEQVDASHLLQATVSEVQDVVTTASQGNLTSRITLENKTGSLRILCEGVNAMLDNMADIIRQILSASEEILTGANEISMGNTDLSARTEQQASNLEETAASMEELTATVKLNADNAKQADALAGAATDIAHEGGKIIGQVITTMTEINQSSQKIVDILSLIDGIAFQTNILALNAAVEAARAGEQGRGFAVVASEVRSLAQRSAGAAKDIKDLIADSVRKIENGNKQVALSGNTMEKIVTSINGVKEMVAQIANASMEQAEGINQVSSAVSQMDEMTQQNAALVEEAAAASESLQFQANQLTQRVSEFRV